MLADLINGYRSSIVLFQVPPGATYMFLPYTVYCSMPAGLTYIQDYDRPWTKEGFRAR